MKKLGIALLGYGTVGGGTYKILSERREQIKAEYGVDAEVLYVVEKFPARAIRKGVPETLITTDIDAVVGDPRVTTVVDCIGGIEPVKTFLTKALMSGKDVVTANKELIAKHWQSLEKAAKETGAGMYFEASCGGGIPVIRTLTEAMQANDILEVKGIVNGTTNFILTKMTAEGAKYEDVLAEAQALGFAEANPSADVDGYDAVYKLSILSTLAFKKHIPIEEIYREGIAGISAEDIKYGKEFGYTIKLLAIGKKRGDEIEVHVHPAFIPDSHPLASVNGSFNAIFLVGNNVGDVMLYGRGAGALPTGSAVVSDIIFSAKQEVAPRYPQVLTSTERKNFVKNFGSEYYLRVSVCDKPGVMAAIAGVFAENNVSITSMQQKAGEGVVPIIFMTHGANELDMQNAVSALKNLSGKVLSVNALIRVEH